MSKFTSLVIAAALSGVAVAGVAQTNEGYVQKEDAFREARVAALRAPDGWLSLVGLEWLHSGVNPVGAAGPNTVHLPPGTPAQLAVVTQTGVGPEATLTMAPPAGGFPRDLKVNGAAAQAGVLPRNATLSFGSYNVVLLSRGDRWGLRIKDAHAPELEHFAGLHWYTPDARYEVTAKWVPYPTPKPVAIATVIGTTLHEEVRGAVEFELNGEAIKLEPQVEGNKLFFVLRDLTSRTTTYQASRFLYAELPSHGLDKPGEVTLDFNKLVNPPCAYTPYATCPLPTEQNKLPIAIAAGEQRYRAAETAALR